MLFLAIVVIGLGAWLLAWALTRTQVKPAVQVIKETETEVNSYRTTPGTIPVAPPPGRDRTRDVESG